MEDLRTVDELEAESEAQWDMEYADEVAERDAYYERLRNVEHEAHADLVETMVVLMWFAA